MATTSPNKTPSARDKALQRHNNKCIDDWRLEDIIFPEKLQNRITKYPEAKEAHIQRLLKSRKHHYERQGTSPSKKMDEVEEKMIEEAVTPRSLREKRDAENVKDEDGDYEDGRAEEDQAAEDDFDDTEEEIFKPLPKPRFTSRRGFCHPQNTTAVADEEDLESEVLRQLLAPGPELSLSRPLRRATRGPSVPKLPSSSSSSTSSSDDDNTITVQPQAKRPRLSASRSQHTMTSTAPTPKPPLTSKAKPSGALTNIDPKSLPSMNARQLAEIYCAGNEAFGEKFVDFCFKNNPPKAYTTQVQLLEKLAGEAMRKGA